MEALAKSGGKRGRKVHVKYSGIGFVPLEEPEKKETA